MDDDRKLELSRLIGASVQGRSHMRVGMRCQDAYLYVICGDVAIAAISDGAGSAELAHLGSSIAVKTVVSTLATSARLRELTLNDVEIAFATTRDAIDTDAKERNRSSLDYACTLLVAVVGPQRTLIGQIGDGAIVGIPCDGGEIQVLSWPQQGEYVNATVFLVQHDIEPFIREERPLSAFSLFSDGLQHVALKYASHSAYSPFFEPFFDALTARDAHLPELERHLAAFLENDRVLASRTDDDLSLIVGIRV